VYPLGGPLRGLSRGPSALADGLAISVRVLGGEPLRESSVEAMVGDFDSKIATFALAYGEVGKVRITLCGDDRPALGRASRRDGEHRGDNRSHKGESRENAFHDSKLL